MKQRCIHCYYFTYLARAGGYWCNRYQKPISEEYVELPNYCNNYAWDAKSVCFEKQVDDRQITFEDLGG